MAERISRYDLTDEMKSYLLRLRKETLDYRNAYRYEAYDEVGAEIVYLKNLMDLTTGTDEGLSSQHKMQRYKVKPQTKLRAGTKNYLKKSYENGVLKQIVRFVAGRPDVCYQASYQGGRRYLIPFGENGTYYPTHTHVYHPQGDVVEEYMVDSSQIVYQRYQKTDENSFAYLYVNYIPNGTYPISGYETGVYRMIDGEITYQMEQEYTWYMEFDAHRKGRPYEAPKLEFLKKDEESN